MEAKFSSFSEIIEKSGNLESFINNHELYWAHFHDQSSHETLNEHVLLVQEYWTNLIDTFRLERVIDENIEKTITYLNTIHNKDLFGNLLKEIFWATMFFHDFGKINDNFQVKRMQNPNFKYLNGIAFGSEHSKPGAFIFFNYYLERILADKLLSKEEKYILTALTLLFANSILKHHAGYINNEILFDTETINSALSFRSKSSVNLNEPYSINFLTKTKTVFQQLQKYFVQDKTAGFPLFILIKLNYSLLTASDYYATSEYMNGLKISDFGVIDNTLRERIIKSFVNNSNKPYNKELIENAQKYLSIPFENLQERSHKNLNILRQKIGAEAIQNLRENKNKQLFYLEAPTGAGKTNISLAFVTELLKLNTGISNIFYVFPFTTLVTQTFQSIKDTIDITDNEIIQLHSRAGFPSKTSYEGEYGNSYKNYIDYLFVNYPFTVLTHIRFFDILKGNSKDTNYLLHRLANSIVIIDELQSYSPTYWDKIITFLDQYAKLFHIKFLIMSATLPKIDELNEDTKGKIVELVTNRDAYFQNPNFRDRIRFELLDWQMPSADEKDHFLERLAAFVVEKSEEYASNNHQKTRAVVEFISKKTASKFLSKLKNQEGNEAYKKYLLSGEILESRRKEIIYKVKNNEDAKVIVVTTQVIEAGVDIDMDLGFKDRSLIDSEEQLAGRINREASKKDCVLYLFDCDKTFWIYKNDYRYKIQRSDEWISENYLSILGNKSYHQLYHRVNEILQKENKDEFDERSHYWDYFKDFNLTGINNKFRLINQENTAVFIPLDIPEKRFNNRDLVALGIVPYDDGKISGEDVFLRYIELIENKDLDFISKNIDLKKMGSIMAQFTISVFSNQAQELQEYCDPEKGRYGYLYLSNWEQIYSYAGGFEMEKIKGDVFL